MNMWYFHVFTIWLVDIAIENGSLNWVRWFMMIYPSLPLSGWGLRDYFLSGHLLSYSFGCGIWYWGSFDLLRFYLAKLAKKRGVGVSNCEHELKHPLIYLIVRSCHDSSTLQMASFQTANQRPGDKYLDSEMGRPFFAGWSARSWGNSMAIPHEYPLVMTNIAMV